MAEDEGQTISLTDDQITSINRLVRLDIDAAFAYEQAIKRENDEQVKAKLTEFKNDHEKHISTLSSVLLQAGEVPPQKAPDLKGYLIEGFTAFRSSIGEHASMKAMKTNEKLTNALYERALDYDLPEFVKGLVRKNREDERRHLEYIESYLHTAAA